MTKIKSKQAYYEAMAAIERYLQKGFASLTAREEDHLEQLSKAVEAWELKEYPMPVQPAFPDILFYLLQQKKYTQSQLSEKLSVSNSQLSSILNGKKQPNLDIVVNLYKTFDIDASVLLESVSEYAIVKKKRKAE